MHAKVQDGRAVDQLARLSMYCARSSLHNYSCVLLQAIDACDGALRTGNSKDLHQPPAITRRLEAAIELQTQSSMVSSSLMASFLTGDLRFLTGASSTSSSSLSSSAAAALPRFLETAVPFLAALVVLGLEFVASASG